MRSRRPDGTADIGRVGDQSDEAAGRGALLGFLKDKLAAYKMPRRVMQMEALPRNATGKILKTKLREIAAEKYAR